MLPKALPTTTLPLFACRAEKEELFIMGSYNLTKKWKEAKASAAAAGGAASRVKAMSVLGAFAAELDFDE